MFDDTIKSIHAQLYERATSPLIGSFLISWALWNYKFILLIFASMPILKKFETIDDIIYPSTTNLLILGEVDIHSWIFLGIIFPILSTLSFIYIYPKLAKPVFEVSRKFQRDMINEKKKIDGEQLLSEEDSKKLRLEHYEIIKKYDDDLSRKDEEINILKQQLDSSQTKQKDPARGYDRRPDADKNYQLENLITAHKWEIDIPLNEHNNNRIRMPIVFSSNGIIENLDNYSIRYWKIDDGYLELSDQSRNLTSRLVYSPSLNEFFSINEEGIADNPSYIINRL